MACMASYSTLSPFRPGKGKPRGRTTMATKRTDHSANPTTDTGQAPKRKTIPASKVGLSLTISDKALKEFDRIQEETIKAAEKDQNFSWR